MVTGSGLPRTIRWQPSDAVQEILAIVPTRDNGEDLVAIVESLRDCADEPEAQSLEVIEREHIIAMLRKTRGVVEGPNGAAQLLEMNPSTVRFRMKKLGISKFDYLTDTGTRSGTNP